MPFIESPNGRIFYHKVGSGPKAIVALHGYERDGTDFIKDIKQDEKELTLYAIDLPYHGATDWKLPLYNKLQLKEVISLLLEQENIKYFTAVGHSLGGRLWLVLAPSFAGHITSLWLLAPDGIATRNMYLFEHLPIPFRQILANALSYPKALLKLANLAFKASVIDARAIRFLEYHLTDEDIMLNLVNTWKAIYHFRLNKKKLQKQLQQNSYHNYFVVGERDQVIDIDRLQRLTKGFENTSFILLKQVSHQSMIAKSLPLMLEHI